MPGALPRRGCCLGLDRSGETRGELNQIAKTRLVYWNLALRQLGDLFDVAVDARHVMAEISEAGTRDEAHIAGTDHGDTHRCSVQIVGILFTATPPSAATLRASDTA